MEWVKQENNQELLREKEITFLSSLDNQVLCVRVLYQNMSLIVQDCLQIIARTCKYWYLNQTNLLYLMLSSHQWRFDGALKRRAKRHQGVTKLD